MAMDLTKQRKLELFGHICRMGTIMQSDQDRDSGTVGGDRGRLVWLEIDVGYAERYTKHGRKNNIRWLHGRAYGVWTGAVVNCQERYNWRTPDKSDEESLGSAADMNIDDIDDDDDDDVMCCSYIHVRSKAGS